MRLILLVTALLCGSVLYSQEETTSVEAQKPESKFSHESELSTIVNGGNTEVETYNFTTKNSYQTGKMTYGFGGHYQLGTTVQTQLDEDGEEEEVKVETARNWDINAKVSQVLSVSLDGFLAAMYEGNEFNGIKQRDNYDLGATYKIIAEEKTKSNFELSYRYTVERTTIRIADDGSADEDGRDEFFLNKARLYYDFEKVLTETTSTKFWAEYIPNFTINEDYQGTFEQSLTTKMSNLLSLKVSYKGIYDNVPVEGAQMMDYIFTTSLIAKF
jgi:putative salt-induced outer membrane protein